MNLIPMGDYYIVYCEWCDSSNKVLWTRMDAGNAYCGACHHPLTPAANADTTGSRTPQKDEQLLIAV